MSRVDVAPEVFGLTRERALSDGSAVAHVATLIHEGAHAACARFLGYEVRERTVRLHPEGQHVGMVRWFPTERTSPVERVRVAMIGPAAQTLWLEGLARRWGTSTAETNWVGPDDVDTARPYLAAAGFEGEVTEAVSRAFHSATELAQRLWSDIVREALSITSDCDCLPRPDPGAARTEPPAKPSSSVPSAIPASSTTTLMGAPMIEQVRHAISLSTDKAETIQAALSQAAAEAAEIRALLTEALQGSGSAEAEQALAAIAHLDEQLQIPRQALGHASEALSTYAARL